MRSLTIDVRSLTVYFLQAFSAFVCERFGHANADLQLAILQAVRVLFRDLDNIDCLISTTIAEIIFDAAALNEPCRNVDVFDGS